jgi:hypothetical protein
MKPDRLPRGCLLEQLPHGSKHMDRRLAAYRYDPCISAKDVHTCKQEGVAIVLLANVAHVRQVGLPLLVNACHERLVAHKLVPSWLMDLICHLLA